MEEKKVTEAFEEALKKRQLTYEVKAEKISVAVPFELYFREELWELYDDWFQDEYLPDPAEGQETALDRFEQFVDYMHSLLFESICDECEDIIGGEYSYCQIQEILEDHVEFHCKGDILTHKVSVSIGIDTGDSNHDFTMNTNYPYNLQGEAGEKCEDYSSIRWLIKQQGYRKTDLMKARRNISQCKSRLLSSIVHEVENEVSHMNQMFFLITATVEEWLVLNVMSEWGRNTGKWPGYIILDSASRCGLTDSMNGGPSLFGISLEKEVKLPVKYIYCAKIDCIKSNTFGYYTLYDSFGSAKLWETGKISQWTIPKKLRAILQERKLCPVH